MHWRAFRRPPTRFLFVLPDAQVVSVGAGPGMGGVEDGEALHSPAHALRPPGSPGTKSWLLRARGWHREARGAHLDISGSQRPSVVFLPPPPAPPCVQAAEKGGGQPRGGRGAGKPAPGQ